VSSGHNGAAAIEPLRRARLIEAGRLGVQLHVPGEDTGAEHPGVVEIVLPGLDEKDLEVVIQIGQPRQRVSLQED
jgi:hypothetical protein